jgi:putative photosynthetic complex assembly protein 2
VLEYGLAFAFTVLVWWASTGAILYLDGLPRRTFPWTMAATSVVASLAVWGLWYSSGQTTVAGAFCGFTCAILIWAWQEVAFLLGYVTGPRRGPCPEGATGWRRARYAFEAVSHHEIALVCLALAVVGATWDRPTPPACGPTSCCGRCARAPSSTCSSACATSTPTSCRRT